MAGALRADALPGVVERAPLAFAADDRDVGAARDLAGGGEQRIRGHRLRLPLQLEPPLVAELDRVAHEPHRLRADQHLARLGRLLEPRRDVDGVAGRQPLLGARHDLAGIDADPAADPELREGVAHLDRGPAGAQASSSCTTGTPKTAITASPTNFSTVPPWRSTISFIRSK